MSLVTAIADTVKRVSLVGVAAAAHVPPTMESIGEAVMVKVMADGCKKEAQLVLRS